MYLQVPVTSKVHRRKKQRDGKEAKTTGDGAVGFLREGKFPIFLLLNKHKEMESHHVPYNS